jgi:phosphatidate cytidylyltransferase
MSNFQKRFTVSLLAFPLIYILLFQHFLFNLLIGVVFILCLYEWINIFQKKSVLFFIGLLILFLFFISLIRIYNVKNYNLIFLWLLLIAWLTDIGGYIFGKLIGGPKLIKISPNKTWAGAIGSIILSQLAFLVFFLESNYQFNISTIFSQFLLSISGQIGDVLMSYVKRINKKKDTSNIIPGHGGILDRADGLIWIMIFGNFFI